MPARSSSALAVDRFTPRRSPRRKRKMPGPQSAAAYREYRSVFCDPDGARQLARANHDRAWAVAKLRLVYRNAGPADSRLRWCGRSDQASGIPETVLIHFHSRLAWCDDGAGIPALEGGRNGSILTSDGVVRASILASHGVAFVIPTLDGVSLTAIHASDGVVPSAILASDGVVTTHSHLRRCGRISIRASDGVAQSRLAPRTVRAASLAATRRRDFSAQAESALSERSSPSSAVPSASAEAPGQPLRSSIRQGSGHA